MDHQRVLVTAGAAGIGREIVRAFAAGGAAVFVCDVSRRSDIERMVGEAIQALGGLDVLVNNAGIAGPTAPVEHMDPDEWEKVIQVDLNGTFNVTRLAIPHLKKIG